MHLYECREEIAFATCKIIASFIDMYVSVQSLTNIASFKLSSQKRATCSHTEGKTYVERECSLAGFFKALPSEAAFLAPSLHKNEYPAP